MKIKKEFIIYVLIGLFGLIIDFGTYTVLTGLKMNYELANVISSTCGIVNNFYWNSYYNFRVHNHLLLRFLSYFAVGQITTVFTTASLFIFTTKMGCNYLLVKFVATGIATVIQFVINKLITFKQSK